MDEYPLKWVTDAIAVGYAPRNFEHLESIRQAGIKAIVNLCAECYDLHEIEEKSGFEVCYLPVNDEGAPNIDGLHEVIHWMNQRVENKQPVLVHCRFGIGRTGTIVLGYLLNTGRTFREARKMMRGTPSWPSTRVQTKIIDQYIKKLEGVSPPNDFPVTAKSTLCRYFDNVKSMMKWDA